MGNILSSGAANESTEKTRIQYLGDRYPFGDGEIIRLSRCHSYLRRARRVRKSFLSDWAVYCASLPPSPGESGAATGDGHEARAELMTTEHRARRAALMQVVEGRILPSGYGRRLERAAFLFRSDVVDYRTSSMADSPASPGPRFGSASTNDSTGASGAEGSPCGRKSPCCGTKESSSDGSYPPEQRDNLLGRDTEDIAFKRLEKFMEGASDCGRRGARPALTVLFKCCSRNSRGGYTSDEKFGTGAGVSDRNLDMNGFADTNRVSIRASASEVLDLGYSLALASAFLSEASTVETLTELNPADYIPEDMGTALSKSLLTFAKKKRSDFRAHLNQPHSDLDLDDFGRPIAAPSRANSERSGESAGSISSASANVHGSENMITLDVFLEWAETVAPCLSAALSTFMHHILFPDRPYPPSRTPFLHPNLQGQSSAFFERPSSPLLFSFACMSPSLGGAWHRLYTSDHDGLSFNRLFTALLGYGGPTLIIIRENNGGIFGAFTASSWKEAKDFYGNSDCFLYQLSPSVGVYRPRGGSSNFMYCNSINRSKGYDGLAHGIGFGGTDELPRLFISETFDACMASSADMTFESGPLLPPAKEGGSQKDFEIVDLEVWGVGGDDAVATGLNARNAQREVIAANIRKARKVDKAQFLEDFQSGLIESKAFKHRDATRGRADCQVDEKHPGTGNYVYEK